MDSNTFQQRLVQASEKAISWAREHVSNHLPSSYLYLLFPNQSYDGNPLEADEEIFPNESLPERKYLGPLKYEQARAFLWRAGKVPEWIDVSVQACDDQFSYLQLLCCGRFTATDELLYHRAEGYQPFHVVSPNIPPQWETVELNGKFDLYWHGHNPLADA
jgi:hypothetical protein